MLTRRNFLKSGAAVTAASVIGITLPTVAEAAMGARFNKKLNLVYGGVEAKGPLGGWESDDAYAEVTATILQDGRTAQGTSSRIPAGATSWSALCKPASLKAGRATAHGDMKVTHNDGTTEHYYWTMLVTLS